MPSETQNLYFHLGLRADDDGVVEAFTVMRLVGATEDSLKLLHAKGFIHVLNDDYVSFITDWHEHNKLRSDRKVDSIYKDLIIQVLPDVKLLEARQRTDRQPKNQGSLKNCGTSQGQPNDNQMTDNGQAMDGIGQDRTGQDRLGKNNNNNNQNIEDVVADIKKQFDQQTNGDISLCKLKILIEKKGLDTVNKYIAGYSKFTGDKRNPEGFLITAIEEEWIIPEIKTKNKYNFAN